MTKTLQEIYEGITFDSKLDELDYKAMKILVKTVRDYKATFDKRKPEAIQQRARVDVWNALAACD